MNSWPGPTELMRLWREGELTEEQRVALLLGGAAHHDPMMLPAYREALVSESLKSIGALNPDPLGPDSIRLWLAVLEGENSRWWALAARRLYACGGPWVKLSALRPDSDHNQELRPQLIDWFKPFYGLER